MLKLLICVPNYPSSSDNCALQYVHIRNKKYIEHGFKVTVLNFSCTHGYELDGIKVVSLSEFVAAGKKYDKLILHAPNIRQHFVFLRNYGKTFSKIVIVFHGHEILKINKCYPPVYKWVNFKVKIERFAHYFYDPIKICIWKKYLPQIADKTDLVFVSNYLFHLFKRYVGVDGYKLGENAHIINNCIGPLFESNKYNATNNKKYDFITIRSRLDASECAMDLMLDLAKSNPQFSFLIIGKGEFFYYNDIPENVTYIPESLGHNELMNYIDEARCALMLTRHDTQGVMSCELASYGIPLITSDIPVCREIFYGFSNVLLVDNEEFIDLPHIYSDIVKKDANYWEKYYVANTVFKEEELLRV